MKHTKQLTKYMRFSEETLINISIPGALFNGNTEPIVATSLYKLQKCTRTASNLQTPNISLGLTIWLINNCPSM